MSEEFNDYDSGMGSTLDPLESRYEVRTRNSSPRQTNSRRFSKKNEHLRTGRNRVTVDNENIKSSGLSSLFSPSADMSRYKDQMRENNITSNEDMESSIKREDNGRLRVEVEGLNDVPTQVGYSYEDVICSKKRTVKVLKPVSYNAVKEVTESLKAGKVLVLCLKHTEAKTASKIFDFALGAASMCGAQVSSEADKTYVFLKGKPLSQEEKLECINQGVVLKS